MDKRSIDRRSSTIPVRVSELDREQKGSSRSDHKRIQSKSKAASSSADTHIPKIRQRPSSSDRQSSKPSLSKATGRTPLRHQYQHAPTTPVTPRSNPLRVAVTPNGGANRFHLGLPTGRRSVSADRISSIGAKSSRKETRPLGDKFYQIEMLDKIDTFFHTHQISSMLNNSGSLKPITLKMFVEVSDYLLKLLDIKQNLTVANYVEELPKMAKKLYYPTPIAKSWLKTANTMHSWPNVLGWISWLVEMAQIRSIALETYSFDKLPFVGTESEAKSKKITFYSMVKFYKAWNDELQEEEDALTQKYLEEIQQQEGATNEGLEQAHMELKEEMQKLETVNEDTNKIDSEVKLLQQQLMTLQKEESQQLSDIKMNDDYIKNAKEEIEQSEKVCASLCEQMKSENAHREELLLRIKEQPMSKVEKDKILEKCHDTQNYIDQFSEHLRDIQNELYTLDMKLASINNSVNKYVLSFNKLIFMNSNNDLCVDLEDLTFPETGILHTEVMETLSPKADLMHKVKDLIKVALNERQSSIQAGSNELESLQERIKVLEDESNDLTSKVAEMKKNMSKIKADAKKEEAKLRDQIKSLECEIETIKESLPNLQKIMSDCEEARDKLDAVCRRKQFIENNAKLFFDQFYKILSEHRKEVSGLLNKLSKLDQGQ